jgi:asparagine synthase (glutamine-hydrolysing)
MPPTFWDRAGKLMAGDRLPPHFGMKARKALLTVAEAPDLDGWFRTFLDEWSGETSPVLGTGRSDALCPFDLDLGTAAPDALRMMYCDAVSYLPDDILCKVDRASMAVSLEVHVPYLDHRVAELAARIPLRMKVQGGGGKRILKTLLYREAPRELFERPKTGFGIPVGEWLKGPLRDWAEDLLDPAALRSQGWFDPAPITRRWDDHRAGRRDSTQALWAILMFQAWLREQSVATAAAA